MSSPRKGYIEESVGRDELERLGGAKPRAVDAAMDAERVDGVEILQ